jgi:threonine aldolase
VIDLRGDTASKPTPGMRRAIARAEVGDEQFGEDPTVRALEEAGADLLGHQAAVFVTSATMANLIALRAQSQPGDDLVGDVASHIFQNELGGPAAVAGLMARGVRSTDGVFGPQDVREVARSRAGVGALRGVVTVENTHTDAGGRVWPVAQAGAVAATGRELGLAAHLDGARLLNAATAARVPARSWSAQFDSVTLCLSKGLGCPFGALLAGSSGLVSEVRRLKRLLGGAMRQAGIVAAAGVYALEHHVVRLEDDHANARRLAEGLAAAGVAADPASVETNCVLVAVKEMGLSGPAAIERLRRGGVRASLDLRGETVRLWTHLDVGSQDVDRAVSAVARALGAGER